MATFFVYLVLIVLASLITAFVQRKEKEFHLTFMTGLVFYGIICVVAEMISFSVHLLAGFFLL